MAAQTILEVCPNPNPEMKRIYKHEIEQRSEPKTSSAARGGAIVAAFNIAGKMDADESVVNWLAAHNLPPLVVTGEFSKKCSGAQPDVALATSPPTGKGLA